MAKVPVYIVSTASTYIGEVECDTVDEYNEKSQELWENQGYDAPSTNITVKFDLGDWDIQDIGSRDIESYVDNPS